MQPTLTTNQRQKKRLIGLLIIGLVVLGIFALLFVMANDTWVVINIPTLPWKAEPSWPAFESQLWVVMLICFVVGMATWALISRLSAIEQRKKAASKQQRIQHLEKELKRANQLLSDIHGTESDIESKGRQ